MENQSLDDLFLAAQDAFVSDLQKAPESPAELGLAPVSIKGLCSRTFDDPVTAMNAVVEEANKAGFNVVYRRTDLKGENGIALRRFIERTEGKSTKSKGEDERKTSTRRINGPWGGMIRYYKSSADKEWHFVIQNDEHNHDFYYGIEHQPSSRRRKRSQSVRDEVLTVSMNKKLKARDVSDHIRNKMGVIQHPKDIENMICQGRQIAMGGFSATQQLIRKLLEDRDAYVSKKNADGDENKPIEHVFWTYRWCMHMWKESPGVISFDATYKTNQFNMPLFQITGVSGLGTTFDVAWVLLKGEGDESFRWALESLMSLGQRENFHLPYTIISDYDSALRSAFCKSFQSQSRYRCACGTL